MSEQEVYRRLIDWLNHTWVRLPETAEMFPLIRARYTVFLRSSFWPGRVDETSKNLASLVNQYFHHGFFDEQYAGVHTRGLRTIPIQGTIQDPRQILPYEEVAKVLDGQDYFTVSICPCRNRKNLDPHSPDCKYPAEVCLHFGRLGHYIVEN